MKHRIKTEYRDPKVNTLGRDAALTFGDLPDISTHEVRILWRPPFKLTVNLPNGDRRVAVPRVVLCAKAVNPLKHNDFITPGGCSWEWAENGTVKINAVGGLTVDKEYELTFLVVG